VKVKEEVVLTLLRRYEWREGTPDQRLKKIQKRAKQRSQGKIYTTDRELDREVARLAKRLRRSMHL
jgi:hypothetical protein